MSAEVETMAYANQVPWHGLGFQVADNLSPQEMLEAAKLNWKVEKKQLFVPTGDGKYEPFDGNYGLIRSSDGKHLSWAGDDYVPIQNEDAMSFFKEFVEAGDMKMETAGSLRGGQYIWGLAKIGESFNIDRKDKVEGYVLMSHPHLCGKGFTVRFTSIRAVCWNTYSAAMAAPFRFVHKKAFDAEIRKAAQASILEASQHMKYFKETATLLAKTKADPAAVTKFFFKVMKINDEDMEKALKEEKLPRTVVRLQEALQLAPGQQLSTAKDTWWGAFNAVTYMFDHKGGRTQDVALARSWFGSRANMKEKALELALDAAKAA